jgi:hypothetical protein
LPFGRCLRCNGQLEPIAREVIEDRLPLRTRREQVDFPALPNLRWYLLEGLALRPDAPLDRKDPANHGGLTR